MKTKSEKTERIADIKRWLNLPYSPASEWLHYNDKEESEVDSDLLMWEAKLKKVG